jgi:DNA-binding protein HU-beta
MNKAELIAEMAKNSGLSKKNSEVALDAFLKTVGEALGNKEKVVLVGFGTFEVRERAERVGRNPRTREEIKIPATVVPAFKAGKGLKDLVK